MKAQRVLIGKRKVYDRYPRTEKFVRQNGRQRTDQSVDSCFETPYNCT